jgi:hypothetical protein
MRLASCFRLLSCTAACLRSTAGPVATARPCRPTPLPLRKQHGGAAHTHYLFFTCTRRLCSARQKWRYPSLSPISILLSQVQGPEPLRPERTAARSTRPHALQAPSISRPPRPACIWPVQRGARLTLSLCELCPLRKSPRSQSSPAHPSRCALPAARCLHL